MKLALLAVCYLLVCSFSSCAIKYPPPIIERCIHNQTNSAECADLRKPDGQKSYTNENLVNYLCTNPVDENKMYGYCSKLREDLIKCENKSCN